MEIKRKINEKLSREINASTSQPWQKAQLTPLANAQGPVSFSKVPLFPGFAQQCNCSRAADVLCFLSKGIDPIHFNWFQDPFSPACSLRRDAVWPFLALLNDFGQRLKGRRNVDKSLCYRHLFVFKATKKTVTGSEHLRFHRARINLARMISVAKIHFVSPVLFFLWKTLESATPVTFAS